MAREVMHKQDGDSVYCYRGVYFGFRPNVGLFFFDSPGSILGPDGCWELMSDSEQKYYGNYAHALTVNSYLEALHHMMCAIDTRALERPR